MEAEETFENNIWGPQEGNRKRGSHAKGQLPNFIVEQKDCKSKKNTSADQLRSRKFGKNERLHE